MIFIKRSAEPEILFQPGQAKAKALCKEYDQGNRSFDFDNAVYGHHTVKQALILMQHGKCCYCESKILHTGPGDVEHYRPKAGYQQNSKDAMQKPGYYWLAYSWDNLLLSCGRCNSKYKKNLFPLLHQNKRAQCHHDDFGLESPLLINPTLTDPKNHIGFRDEIPYPIDDSPYGNTTIAVLGLDREELNEIRREKMKLLKAYLIIIKLAEECLDLFDEAQKARLLAEAENARYKLSTASMPNAEYSAMVSFMLP
jgi:uncharacterized protein (TIGR02646 family)